MTYLAMSLLWTVAGLLAGSLFATEYLTMTRR